MTFEPSRGSAGEQGASCPSVQTVLGTDWPMKGLVFGVRRPEFKDHRRSSSLVSFSFCLFVYFLSGGCNTSLVYLAGIGTRRRKRRHESL